MILCTAAIITTYVVKSNKDKIEIIEAIGKNKPKEKAKTK